MKRMKLGLHLIPQTCFRSNLRNHLGQRKWSIFSRKIRRENNFTCKYCGFVEDRKTKKYTHLHEIWEFDDKNKIQRLIGFECICPDCHNVHHWGYSEYRGLNLKYLLDHACTINSCSSSEFKEHIAKERKLWEERSSHEWTLDLGKWKNL